MVITEKEEDSQTLRQLVKDNPDYLEYLFTAFNLLIHQNETLKKIASKYSHDLRSPVTNISMLLQLYDKAEQEEDRKLYVQKIGGSITRLQEGFEKLSAERKKSLVSHEECTPVHLEMLAAEVKGQLAPNVKLETDFTAIPELQCNPENLRTALILLTDVHYTGTDVYNIRFTSEKGWSGPLLYVTYPENNTEKQGTGIKKWNLYFAVLFLEAYGATVEVTENTEGTTKVVISHTI